MKDQIEKLFAEEREIRKEQQNLERLRRERLIEREAYRESMNVTYEKIKHVRALLNSILKGYKDA
jgi:ribosomal protein L19E